MVTEKIDVVFGHFRIDNKEADFNMFTPVTLKFSLLS